MNITAYARATLGALALSVLAGCGGTQNFTVDETFIIDGTPNGTPDTTEVDLAAIAGDAWKHRDKIKDAKITSLIVTVNQILTGNTAETATGYASIARAGDEVEFARKAGVPVAVGSVVEAKNLKETSKVIKSALDGDGKFSVTANANSDTAGARVHIEIRVLMDVEVEWSLF